MIALFGPCATTSISLVGEVFRTTMDGVENVVPGPAIWGES
jgi:hypothetical protein